MLVLGKTHHSEVHGEGFGIDLANRESVDWACGELERLLQGENIEQFVWAAGYGWRGMFGDQPDTRVMAEVNFGGALPFVQVAWRQMKSQPSPSNLTIIGSTSSVKPRPDEAVYVATKHAQAGLARSLGIEAEAEEAAVKVSFIMPGSMKTPFWDENNLPSNYDTFNDPVKIATKIVEITSQQTESYTEASFPRGTLQ